MFRFANIEMLWWLCIIPISIVAYIFYTRLKKRQLSEFGDPNLVAQLMPDASKSRSVWKFSMLLLALALLIIASARPQYGKGDISIKRQGIEVMVALDISNSMMAEDVAPNRLGRAKQLVSKLVDDMECDNRSISDDDIMLSLKNFYVDMPGEKVKGIDLKLRRGEILGIGGLAGQGKVGVPNGILGLYPAAGEIEFDGEKIDPSKLGDALHKGIAFVSEDRRGVGLLLNESIEQNIIFTALQIQGKFLKKIGPFTQFDKKAAKNHALDMIKALDIRCTGPDQYAGRLSGGNQQKVCLARAITMEPKLLIVSEPTRGIDIGAKKLVLELLAKMNREQGMTIIMVSSELNELRSLCDRIAIVSDGKLTGIFAPDASDAEYGLAMSGVTEGGNV